jgi:hypothetical protein
MNERMKKQMRYITQGHPVYIPYLAVDVLSDELVALHLVGSPANVKSSWAKLMNGGRGKKWLLGNQVQVNGTKKHDVFKTLLPCGALDMWVVNKQASFLHASPNQMAYILPMSPEAKKPDGFFLRLNNMLHFPILPAWEAYLWQMGKATNLVLEMDTEGHRWFKLLEKSIKTDWEQLVKNGLLNHQIQLEV